MSATHEVSWVIFKNAKSKSHLSLTLLGIQVLPLVNEWRFATDIHSDNTHHPSLHDRIERTPVM